MRVLDRRGATLVEILISVGILATIMYFVSHLLLTSHKAVSDADARREADAQIQEVMTRLKRDLSNRRQSMTPSGDVSLPSELLAKPFIGVASCRPGGDCPSVSYALASSAHGDRKVTLTSTCNPPIHGAAPGWNGTTFAAPCVNSCPTGQVPGIRIDDGLSVLNFPKGINLGSAKLVAMSACISLPTVPPDANTTDVQLDLAAAFVNQNGTIGVSRRSVTIPLETTLGSGITLER